MKPGCLNGWIVYLAICVRVCWGGGLRKLRALSTDCFCCVEVDFLLKGEVRKEYNHFLRSSRKLSIKFALD